MMGMHAWMPMPGALVDVEGSYAFNHHLKLVVGAENLFDTKPSKQTAYGGNVSGLVYSETSPYGFNGGYYFMRAIWNF